MYIWMPNAAPSTPISMAGSAPASIILMGTLPFSASRHHPFSGRWSYCLLGLNSYTLGPRELSIR